LDNAVKYTPADGAVAGGVRARDGQAVIEIADSGPGVPAAHARRIFERFYRVDQSRTEVSGGAGLGLAIAKWAVEANDGRIGYETQEGGGSLFRLILPLVAKSN
jgi:signal transduction histidine kinase